MKKAAQASPNRRLREARIHHYWTQSQVAEQLGTTVVNVNRWESGTTTPGLFFRQKLCELFGKTPEELGLLPEAERQELSTAPVAVPPIWNVPFRRNPYFTGREDVLGHLAGVLHAGTPVALVQTQALSGLGGIGKTQTAVEYAYRQQHTYQAVLWARADSRELLTADFVALAALLNVPEKEEQDQSRAVQAVQGWLKDSRDWLLILDNVEELELVSDFLPASSQGHLLLTTRGQSTGSLAKRIDLEQMEPEEGALLLLRRAKLLEPTAGLAQASAGDRAKAFELALLLGGLPLALDQAAAYIEETDCGLAGYLERYQTCRSRLLNRRGSARTNHPEAVSTTWSLSFEKVQQANPSAADLLRLCAFLHPDAIPEELISTGDAQLGPRLESLATDPLALDAAISELRKYSLVRRDAQAHLLQVHRLVQAVLQDTLTETERHLWAGRAICAVNAAFPHAEYSTWALCERLLPQALTATHGIEQHQMISQEAGRLLYETASYLQYRARYAEAESLYRQALRIQEHQLGPEHPDIAFTLNGLAALFYEQGQYAEAEPLYQRALHIREQQLGPEHPQVAIVLNNLAALFREQGQYAEAESLYQQALRIFEQQLGPEHPDVATSLHNLGDIYFERGQYAEAESLYQRALHIWEQQLGSEHPQIAHALNGLAKLSYEQGKYEQAEPLYQRALHIREQHLVPTHLDLAETMHDLALLREAQGNGEEARTLYAGALAIREQALVEGHAKIAQTRTCLTALLHAMGRHEEAARLEQGRSAEA